RGGPRPAGPAPGWVSPSPLRGARSGGGDVFRRASTNGARRALRRARGRQITVCPHASSFTLAARSCPGVRGAWAVFDPTRRRSFAAHTRGPEGWPKLAFDDGNTYIFISYPTSPRAARCRILALARTVLGQGGGGHGGANGNGLGRLRHLSNAHNRNRFRGVPTPPGLSRTTWVGVGARSSRVRPT